MNGVLPGWIVGDADSVRAEAAPYREMTVDQRRVLLAAACRAVVDVDVNVFWDELVELHMPEPAWARGRRPAPNGTPSARTACAWCSSGRPAGPS